MAGDGGWHRTKIVQNERLRDQLAEASPSTLQKHTQLDATTDGAEEVTATEAELLAERELQEQSKKAPDREVYAGAAAVRQLTLEAATEEAEPRQKRTSSNGAVIQRFVADQNYEGAARVQAKVREEYATEETDRVEQRRKQELQHADEEPG